MSKGSRWPSSRSYAVKATGISACDGGPSDASCMSPSNSLTYSGVSSATTDSPTCNCTFCGRRALTVSKHSSDEGPGNGFDVGGRNPAADPVFVPNAGRRQSLNKSRLFCRIRYSFNLIRLCLLRHASGTTSRSISPDSGRTAGSPEGKRIVGTGEILAVT
jgi:hypothetical protein